MAVRLLLRCRKICCPTALSDSAELQKSHTAQLTATVGSAAYVDGVMLDTIMLEPDGPVVTPMTLSRAIYEGIAAMRAMAYLPLSNVTDADPSTYFLTRNFVLISNAAAAAVVATSATISNAGSFYTSPVVITVAAFVIACVAASVAIFIASRNALNYRIQPLEHMSKLPNSVLQRLEMAAARSVAAAERAIEYIDAVEADTDDSQVCSRVACLRQAWVSFFDRLFCV
jgi:hypothetical protein